jgi:hypothetical protein
MEFANSQAQPRKDYRLIACFSCGFIQILTWGIGFEIFDGHACVASGYGVPDLKTSRHGGKHRAFGADKSRGGPLAWADADLISGGGTPVWASDGGRCDARSWVFGDRAGSGISHHVFRTKDLNPPRQQRGFLKEASRKSTPQKRLPPKAKPSRSRKLDVLGRKNTVGIDIVSGVGG